MKGIELNIYHHTDDTRQMAAVGMEVDMSNYIVKPVTFFKIEAIGVDRQQGVDYGLIYACDDTFTCELTYEELKDKLENYNEKNS